MHCVFGASRHLGGRNYLVAKLGHDNLKLYIDEALLIKHIHNLPQTTLTSLSAGSIFVLHISIWWWKSLSVTISSSMTFALRCALVIPGGAGRGGSVGGEGGAGDDLASVSCLAE